MVKILNKIIKFSLYLVVFLLPLFWLPFSFEAFEFNKLYLLLFFVSLALLAWVAKMVLIDKKIHFRQTPLDIPVLIFLLVAIISAILSVDKNSSIFGFYGQFSTGLITLLTLGALYFLITNNTEFEKINRSESEKNLLEATDKSNQEKSKNSSFLISASSLLKTFLYSSFFVILISYLSILGVWQKFENLPPIMLQKTFNPVSGSLEGLSIFLAILIAFLVGSLISSFKKGRLFTISNYLLLVLSFGLLTIIDYSPAWIVLIGSLGVCLIFTISTRILREDINRLLLPIFLILTGIVFLFININLQFPRETVLDQRTSWKTAFGAATENIKSGFFGSGIGTYYYNFTKFKPLEFNESPLWQARFNRAGSQLAEIFGTIGFLGLISYFLLISSFFLIYWLLRKKIEFLPFVLIFLALFFGQIFYYQNLTLAFLFWLILGLSATALPTPTKKWWAGERVIVFHRPPELSLVFSTGLILLCFAVVAIYFFGIKFYLADVNYRKAQLLPLGEEKIKFLEKAVNFNPHLVNYRRVLAVDYLREVFEEVRKPLAEQKGEKIQNFLKNSVEQAKIATELAPNDVTVQETLASIYREIRAADPKATEWAIIFFQKAIKLEPTNPILYTEIGKLYLESDLQKAKENFAKAKELKPDYLDALLQEALIFERENNLEEAIKKVEELVRNYPLTIETIEMMIEIKFQLGRLYFNKERIDEAIFQFETNIQLNPNHLNSLHFLGMAYAKKGEKEKAISAFERVLELNPGNVEAIQKLEELKK